MKPTHSDLSIERAAIIHHDLIAIMLTEYLSELGADTNYPYLHLYWKEAERIPYLFRIRDELIGFGLVRTIGCRAYEMAEFWIKNRHRRNGIGRTAATALFETQPGEWSVSSYPGSIGSEIFWRKVTARYHPEITTYNETSAPSYRFQVQQ
ncbi:MAG: GNAT family N-acetyltransferase [Comamonas sp.]